MDRPARRPLAGAGPFPAASRYAEDSRSTGILSYSLVDPAEYVLQHANLLGRIRLRLRPQPGRLGQRHRLERPFLEPVRDPARPIHVGAAQRDDPACAVAQRFHQRARLAAGAEDEESTTTSADAARNAAACSAMRRRSPMISRTPAGGGVLPR